MFPTSSYKRLYNDIIDRYDTYSDDEYVTFGILIADARQGEAREYILNYLNVFRSCLKNKYCTKRKITI